MSWKYTLTASNDWAYTVTASNDWSYTVTEGDSVFMDNIYQLDIDGTPDFDGQYAFDILLDDESDTNSLKTDLYVGLNDSWSLIKEMAFECDNIHIATPTSLVRAVESDDNFGLTWTAQRTTGYLSRVISKQFVTKYNEVRVKIAARAATELALSDYASLEAAITALNSAGAGSQLNIDQDITMAVDDTPPIISVDDVIIYSDNQSVITLGTNNTGSRILYFTGDDVHCMGLSVNVNKDNQTNTFSAIVHLGCDGFSVIGCDCRNSNYHVYQCSGASNGVYGACVGLVSGDDCFTAIATSDNIIMEFCVAGCSEEILGASRGFEYEDGDTYCTLYKNIVFGQVGCGCFEAHVHPGAGAITNLLFEECLSLYSSEAIGFTGNNLTTEVVSDSTILNCHEVGGLYISTNMANLKDCIIQGCDIDKESNSSILYLSASCDAVSFINNSVGTLAIYSSENCIITNNNVYPSGYYGIGISLWNTDNCNLNGNTISNQTPISNGQGIKIRSGDNNIINSTVIDGVIAVGIELTETSDGNTGTGNDLDDATVDISDESSGTNTIT